MNVQSASFFFLAAKPNEVDAFSHERSATRSSTASRARPKINVYARNAGGGNKHHGIVDCPV